MARFQAGPNTFFPVGPAEQGKPQGFAVKRGDVTGSPIGANYYVPEFQRYLTTLGSNPVAGSPLADYVDVNPTTEVSGLDPDALVGFIPMQAVSDGATGEYTVSDRPLRELRTGYTSFRDGDVLWAKITPSMQNGKSCIVEGLPNGIGFGSTEFHVARVRDSDVSAKFVMEFLSQVSVRRIATYTFTGSAGQQRVPSSFLERLPFPKLPTARQQELVGAMDAARVERKGQLEEADKLLAGLDAFIFDSLGLEFSTPNPTRTYAVRNQVVKQRLDSHFHSPEFSQLHQMLSRTHCEPLGSIATFSRETWKPQDHGQETFRYIEISNVDPKTGEAHWNNVPTSEAPSRARMEIQAGDLIVSLTRPHRGSIAQLGPEFEGCVASTGFAVIRNVAGHVRRDYLWCILRSSICLSQMRQRSSGGNYPAITEAELGNIAVPVPEEHIQSHVATEVVHCIQEALRLRSEAERGWQEAKRWFEVQLLGPIT